MPVGPVAAPIFAAGQVECHRPGEIVGILKLLESAIRIGDSSFPVEVVVIECNHVAVGIGDGAEAACRIRGKTRYGRDAVERWTRDRGQLLRRNSAAVSVGSCLVLRVFPREQLALGGISIDGYLASGVGVSQDQMLGVTGKLSEKVVRTSG